MQAKARSKNLSVRIKGMGTQGHQLFQEQDDKQLRVLPWAQQEKWLRHYHEEADCFGKEKAMQLPRQFVWWKRQSKMLSGGLLYALRDKGLGEIIDNQS